MNPIPLSPGETRTVEIHAATYNNATDVLLQPGVTYQFRAAGTWCDASIECGPDGYDTPKLRFVRWMRRSRRNQWFALMGHAGGQTFLIGSAATITATEAGELFCYANDVPLMYWNNTKSVTLTIVR